jgi:hypothetical protein
MDSAVSAMLDAEANDYMDIVISDTRCRSRPAGESMWKGGAPSVTGLRANQQRQEPEGMNKN